MAVIIQEYDNQGEFRHYPFTDASTLTSTTGTALPSDFILDASIYPQGAVGACYLSLVDVANSMIIFAADNGAIAFAPYNGGDVATVRLLGPMPIPIGVIVYGAGRERLTGSTDDYHFSPTATTLTPRACVPVPTEGVRGIQLPDGTVVTGNVRFRGEGGVRVSTEYQSVTTTTEIPSYDPDVASEAITTTTQVPTLRIDVVGMPLRIPEDCEDDLPPPVRAIHVSAKSHGPIGISAASAGDLFINLRGVSLTDLCESQKAHRRTDKVVPVPLPLWAGPLVTHVFRAASLLSGGRFGINAPSADDYINPISVQALPPVPVAPPRVAVPPTATPEEIAASVERNMTAPKPGGGIMIKLHGFNQAQRK